MAHRILHPPHGLIEGRGLSFRRPLFRPVTQLTVFGEGAVLGKATVARPYVDDEMDVRIPDTSRLLHTYLIGRTGVGKTNSLKNIVRHDLSGRGPVIAIDPHGDLYDYAIKDAMHRDTLVALDFTGDRVPSLNPLYLDAKDTADVDENIEQYIDLTLNSMYFEWAHASLTCSECVWRRSSPWLTRPPGTGRTSGMCSDLSKTGPTEMRW